MRTARVSGYCQGENLGLNQVLATPKKRLAQVVDLVDVSHAAQFVWKLVENLGNVELYPNRRRKSSAGSI